MTPPIDWREVEAAELNHGATLAELLAELANVAPPSPPPPALIPRATRIRQRSLELVAAALAGDQDAATHLTEAEITQAVTIGLGRSFSVQMLAGLLLLTPAEVSAAIGASGCSPVRKAAA